MYRNVYMKHTCIYVYMKHLKIKMKVLMFQPPCFDIYL